jgi:glycosyltransferase involved in cell wall biosynthesis
MSGVPVVVKYLAEGLAQRGHDISIVTRSEGNPVKHEIYNGVHIYRFDMYQNVWKNPAGDTKGYIPFVADFHPDVLILECATCMTTDLLMPHLHGMECKVLFHAHGFTGYKTKEGPFAIKDGFLHTIGYTYNWVRNRYYYNYWFKKYASEVDMSAVLHDNDNSKSFWDALLGPKSYVLDNAADDMFFKDYSQSGNPLNELIDLNNKKYCFSCANYQVVKDQKNIIREFYRTSIPDLALVCVGGEDNAYYHECVALRDKCEAEYGHRDVYLLHHVERKLIPLIESKASLYLVSSLTEQYSISIIEAMAQGVPFISTNVGNARFLPGGVTLASPNEMHTAIDRLLTDRAEYARLSHAGKEFAYTNCRIDVAVDKLEKILMA